MRHCGKKSLDEIKERLVARGLIEAPLPSAEGDIVAADEIGADEVVELGEAGDAVDEGNTLADEDEQVRTGAGREEQ